MFLRRQLLRARIPFPHRAVVSAAPLSRRFLVSNTSTSPVLHTTTLNGSHSNGTAPDATSDTGAYWALSTEQLFRVFHNRNPLKLAEESPETYPDNLLRAYRVLHRRYRSSIRLLPRYAFHRTAFQAREARSADVMDYLATDILDTTVFVRSARARTEVIITLLGHSLDGSLLSRDKTISLLQMLNSMGTLTSLSPKIITRFVQSVVTPPASSTSAVEKASLETIVTLVIPFLRRTTVPADVRAMDHQPSPLVRVSFGLVRLLLRRRLPESALALFRALVDTGNVPPDALQEGNTSKDFDMIIHRALVRSCLHWNWQAEANSLILDMIAMSQPDQTTLDIAVDVMYSQIEAMSLTELDRCCSLMCTLDDRVPSFILPAGLIRLFYRSAEYLEAGKTAELFFAHTQSKKILAKAAYPPPRDAALTWMMRHLMLTSGNMHLGRRLAILVVDNDEPVVLSERARFVCLLAANGYARQARTLWEKFAADKASSYIRGNTRAMLRLITLFKSRAARVAEKVPTEDIRTGKDLVEESVTRIYHETQRDDYLDFARHVLNEFKSTVGPLAGADHQQMTSLARALFVMGDLTEGFKVFGALLERKERPDMFDLNVLLAVVSKHDPRRAAAAIEKMIQTGVEVDSITFGTAIHHAGLHGDNELVIALTKRVRELHGELTLKTVSSLLRFNLDSSASYAELRAALLRAWNVVRVLADASVVCTARTGKYCVLAALKADDPVIAYNFWALLVKEKTEWGDREQRFHRALIAEKIADHRAKKKINYIQSMSMLLELGSEGSRWR
ncbi:hypothetical protein PLICRDRAFT_164350 [Plicaturopsis crispa FD-325 SS-3]|nr:hypothetical protein PLICRDRAFT_164350 [Plicaturopsis crispa FD-325 SS-3]